MQPQTWIRKPWLSGPVLWPGALLLSKSILKPSQLLDATSSFLYTEYLSSDMKPSDVTNAALWKPMNLCAHLG